MHARKGVAVALIVVGAAGLFFGDFSWTRTTQAAQIGPLELQVKDRRSVNIPVWAGMAAIVVGAGILLVPIRK
ncbi:MAG TPA: hypothetical protein VGJ96_03190 [Gemmatimonadaceae bacterium]|jgi:uncharacterized membrane protein YidH (DUF202 family)